MRPPSTAAVPLGLVPESRGVGLIQLLQDRLPRWAIEAFAAATHLGDAAVLLALAALVYLAYDRTDGAFVLGALFAGFALVIAAKASFGYARPPAALQYVAETGYGFPSGHAVGVTVGWGALAIVLERISSSGRRVAIAAVVIGLVALSRVVIGVHYLVDVVGGVAVGLAVLWSAGRWMRRSPLLLFGAAAGLAAIAVAVDGGSTEALALFGACLGAVVGWQLIEPADRPYGRQAVFATIVGGVFVGAVSAVVAPTAALAFGGGAVVTAGGLLLPLAGSRTIGGEN